MIGTGATPTRSVGLAGTGSAKPIDSSAGGVTFPELRIM